MNRQEIRELLSEILVAAPTQPNANFSRSRLDRSINRRYRFEIQAAILEGLRQYFRRKATVLWPANQQVLEIPEELRNIWLERIDDETHVTPGSRVVVANRPTEGSIFWEERNKIRWGIEGPPEDKNLGFYYVGRGEALLSDVAEPLLIDETYQPILAWSSAVELISMDNQRTPPDWNERLLEYRLDWYKSLSVGRPMEQVPTVVQLEGNHWTLSVV